MRIRKTIKKYITVAVIMAVLICCSPAFYMENTMAADSFIDVTDTSEPYYTPVYWAAGNDIARGFPDGTFRPDDTCTRLQFVVFLWRMMGRPSSGSDLVSFTDIDHGMSTFNAVAWAVEEGIVKGYSDGSFRPEDTILRKHAAIMLWRLAGKPDAISAENVFSDLTDTDPAYKAVLWGTGTGIIKGADGAFMPDDNCLRKHIVIFLYRYQKKQESIHSYSVTRSDAVNEKGQRISGELYIPEEISGKTVILCHGLGGNREGMMTDYARALAEEGHICYTFDFCGGGLTSQSEGSMTEMSVLTEVKDLEAVFKMISELNYADSSQIYIAGHSQGALVAGLFAARHPDLPAGLIFMSAAFVIPKWVRSSFPDYKSIPETYHFMEDKNWNLGRQYAQDIYYMDAYSECRGYNGKVLILHGKMDTGVDYQDAYDIAEIYPGSSVIVYEYADHLLEGGGSRSRSYNDILAFLE